MKPRTSYEARTEGNTVEEPEHRTYGPFISGDEVSTGDALSVTSPYDGSEVATIDLAGPAEIEQAIAAAREAFAVTRKLASWEKAKILANISSSLDRERDALAATIAKEAGKPIKTARLEVERAAFTFQVAAEEAKRLDGEIVALDWLPGNEHRTAHLHRVPRGPIAGITPFNFPLNLVAHKVAPALAAGNPIVIRPASQTPLSALKLARMVHDAGWPAGGIAVVPSRVRDAGPLVEDGRIALLSFTGSPAVGWQLKSRAGRKPVTLELGGNAGTIVHHDADVDEAAKRVAWGGFSYAGQSCISVQRVYVHEDVYESFLGALVPLVRDLVAGDPLLEETDVGPVIDSAAAERIEAWLREAVAGGAKVVAGGERDGGLIQPTLLTDVREDMSVSCQEVFGPIVSVSRYRDVDAALAAVDDSDYGLQAGLFTYDTRLVQRAFDRLDVGGIIVNDVSTFRIDHMPYGGVKASGTGREGVRYAMSEMTELKMVAFNHGA